MKLKRILAVALAATTALSSGTAYDLIAKTGVASAADVAYDKDDTFPVTSGGVTYTFTVTDKGRKSGDLTTGGNVKLTGFEPEDDDKDYSVALGDLIIPDDFKTSKNAQYNLTEIDVEASAVNTDHLVGINLKNNTLLKKVVLKDYDSDDVVFTLPTTSDGAVDIKTHLETVDFTNSNVEYSDVAKYIHSSTDKLETLKLKGLLKNTSSDNNKKWDLSSFTLLKTADLSGNDNVTEIKVNRGNISTVATTTYGAAYLDATGKHYPLTLNISGDSALETLEVRGGYDANGGALSTGNKGVSFITNDADEGSRDVDLSGFDITKLVINGAGIEKINLPTGEKADINVSNNNLVSIDVSGSEQKIDASYNRLLDIEVSSCGDLTDLNLKNNFLTSIDVSALDDKLKNNLNVSGNFIPKDNFVKASSGQGGLSLGEQRNPDLFAFGLTGDAGLKSNTSDKANGIIKLGGSANVVAAIVVGNAPQGFIEKYVETFVWKEANENGGAVTLGEGGILGTQYKYKGDGDSSNMGEARIFAYAPITGSDAKASSENINLTIGGKKKTCGVQADNALIITYDVTTNLPANKIADDSDNAYIKDYGMVFAPAQAAIIPSSGTASVKLDAVAPKVFSNVHDNTAFGQMKGVQLSSWNTSADGSGTNYKYSKRDSGKTIKVSEDITLYAQYTEKTFTVNFDKGKVAGKNSSTAKYSGSKPANMKGLSWGEEVSLSANNYTSTTKVINGSSSDTSDNAFLCWVKDGYADTHAYTDGSAVHGDIGDKNSYTDKKPSTKLVGLWNNGNYSLTLGVSSITMALENLDKNVKDLGDLDASVEELYDVKTKADEKDDKKLVAYSTDTGVVDYKGGFLYAKGEGSATVYVYDQANGAVASLNVTVTKDGSDAVSELTKDLLAGKNVKADNGQTVKLNKDGKTVTLTKGKNQKNVKINTVTIDGVTYKVTAIAAGAFKGMSKIQTVVIGNNVKTIGKIAFANCKNLKKVTMGKNVKKIGERCFKNDKKLAKVLIKSKKLTKNSTLGKNTFQKTKSGIKFYIAKKAATFKKIKKVIKARGNATKAKYVKKYA